MQVHHLRFCRRHIVPIALSLLSMAALDGCMMPAERQRLFAQRDAVTCADVAEQDGASEYAQCMLAQQHRRDTQRTQAFERAAAMSEITRNQQETTESRIRRCKPHRIKRGHDGRGRGRCA